MIKHIKNIKKPSSNISFWKFLLGHINIGLILSYSIFASDALAVQPVSNTFIQSTVNSSDSYERVQDKDYQFEKVEYIDAGGLQGVQTIGAFHQKLKDFHKSALGEPNYVPIINGDITLILPLYPLAKRIGDEFVQARFVRSQIYNTLQRNLLVDIDANGNRVNLYADEKAQINDLYNKAFEFAQNTNRKFGEQVTEAEVNSFGKNFIWPELREINGENVLVPIVHLTDATVDKLLVNAHVIEFSGENTSFNNITVNAGNVFALNNTFLDVANNTSVIHGGAIIADGDLNLTTGGTLQLLSGSLSAQDNVTIIADRLHAETFVHRYTTRFGNVERLGAITSIDSASGNVSVETPSDIVVVGGEVSGNNISFNAGGDIRITSVQTTSSEDNGYGWSNTTVQHIASTLGAEETISLIAAGAITIDASSLHADQGHIELLAEMGITIEDSLNVSHRTYSSGSTSSEAYKTVAMRSILDAGKGLTIHSEAGNIKLKAAAIESGEGATVKASNGSISLLISKETDHYSYTSVEESLLTTTVINRGHTFETAVQNTIVGGLTVEALYGLNIEYEGVEGGDFNEQIEAFRDMEGLEWLAEIHDDPTLDVDWTAVETVYNEWNEKNTSLSAAAMIIIAIVVSVVTAGAGAALVGAAAQTATAAVANAALTSMVTISTQAASNALVNGGSPLEIFEASYESVLSEDSAKRIAVSMATAGAMANLDAEFFTGMSDKFGTAGDLSLLGQATQAITHSAVSAGISTVVYGDGLEEFGDTFVVGLAQNAINTIGQGLTEKIIEADFSEAMNYIAHASLNCVTGAISSELSDESAGNGCATGAGSAVLSLAVEDAFSGQREALEADQKEIAEFLEENFSGEDIFDQQGNLIPNSFPLNTYTQVTKYDKIRTQLHNLTDKVANISRLTAAVGAFISGASEAQLNIADRQASLVSNTELLLHEREIRNATFIHQLLIQEQNYKDLSNRQFHVESLPEEFSHLIPDSFDPSENVDKHISGRDLYVMQIFDKLANELGDLLPSELVHSDIPDSETVVEIYGGVAHTSLRNLIANAFNKGADDALKNFRDQIDNNGGYTTNSQRRLEYIYNEYFRQTQDADRVYGRLELYSASIAPIKVGSEAAGELASNARRLADETIEGLKQSSKINRVEEFVENIDEVVTLSDVQKAALKSDLSKAGDDLIEALEANPFLVDTWKVLDNASVPQALRSDIDTLIKVNRYLGNNPGAKNSFIDDLTNSSNPEKFVDRTSWRDDILQRHSDDGELFQAQGLSRSDLPQSLVDDMIDASSAPPAFIDEAVDGVIKAGSDIPITKAFSQGDELFKIVPKEGGVTEFSPYWLTKAEWDNVKDLSNMEQKLGLPIGSHAVEYDVYKITANQTGNVFESTIAPTLQDGFETIGGATQTLVLDRSLWSTPVKIGVHWP